MTNAYAYRDLLFEGTRRQTLNHPAWRPEIGRSWLYPLSTSTAHGRGGSWTNAILRGTRFKIRHRDGHATGSKARIPLVEFAGSAPKRHVFRVPDPSRTPKPRPTSKNGGLRLRPWLKSSFLLFPSPRRFPPNPTKFHPKIPSGEANPTRNWPPLPPPPEKARSEDESGPNLLKPSDGNPCPISPRRVDRPQLDRPASRGGKKLGSLQGERR